MNSWRTRFIKKHRTLSMVLVFIFLVSVIDMTGYLVSAQDVMRNGNYEKAYTMLQSIPDDQKNAEDWYHLAFLHYVLQKESFEKKVPEFSSRSLEKTSSDRMKEKNYYLLSNLYLSLNETEKTLDIATKLKRLKSKHGYQLLGFIYSSSDINKAHESYKKAADLGDLTSMVKVSSEKYKSKEFKDSYYYFLMFIKNFETANITQTLPYLMLRDTYLKELQNTYEKKDLILQKIKSKLSERQIKEVEDSLHL